MVHLKNVQSKKCPSKNVCLKCACLKNVGCLFFNPRQDKVIDINCSLINAQIL